MLKQQSQEQQDEWAAQQPLPNELDDEGEESGTSILAQKHQAQTNEKGHKRSKSTGKTAARNQVSSNSAGKIRLISFFQFLLYIILLAGVGVALYLIGGPPSMPRWSWSEIWSSLTSPANNMSLNFIKYCIVTIGWIFLVYIGVTMVMQLMVDALYGLSLLLGHGQPSHLAIGLKRVSGRITVGPLRRTMDGLIFSGAVFALLTTVASGAGGHGGTSGGAVNHNTSNTNLDDTASGNNSVAMTFHQNYVGDAGFTPSNNNNQPTPGQFGQNSSNTSLAGNSGGSFNLTANTTNGATGSVNLNNANPLSNQSRNAYDLKIQHIVKEGDTLWNLAEHYYGDGNQGFRIYNENLGQPVGGGQVFGSDGIIKPGWVLQISGAKFDGHLAKAFNVSDGGNIDSNSGAAGKAQNANAANSNNASSNGGYQAHNTPTAAAQTKSQESYTVKPNDTLRSIAQRYLGDESKWPEIWQLNVGHTMANGQLATNPDLIYPGWKLEMPAASSSTNLNTANNQTTTSNSDSTSNNSTTATAATNNNTTNANTATNDNGTKPTTASSSSTTTKANGTNQTTTGSQASSANNNNSVSNPGAARGLGNLTTPTPTAPISTPAPTVSSSNSTVASITTTQQTTPVSATAGLITATSQPTEAAPTSASNTTPAPATITSVAATSSSTANKTQPASQPSAVAATKISSDNGTSQSLPWPLFVAGTGGLAGAVGFTLGLRKVGGALRKRWHNNQISHAERSQEASEEAVEEFETEFAPFVRLESLIDTDEEGNQIGYAYSYRASELLKLRQRGYFTDKSLLIFERLLTIFERAGLPPLTPVSCTEGVSGISYILTGGQAALNAYLNRLPTTSEAEDSDYYTNNLLDEESEGEGEDWGLAAQSELTNNKIEANDEEEDSELAAGKESKAVWVSDHNQWRQPKEENEVDDQNSENILEFYGSQEGGRENLGEARAFYTEMENGEDIEPYDYSEAQYAEIEEDNNLATTENRREKGVLPFPLNRIIGRNANGNKNPKFDLPKRATPTPVKKTNTPKLNNTKTNLVELIEGYLGGLVSIELGRDVLALTLEDLPAKITYLPIYHPAAGNVSTLVDKSLLSPETKATDSSENINGLVRPDSRPDYYTLAAELKEAFDTNASENATPTANDPSHVHEAVAAQGLAASVQDAAHLFYSIGITDPINWAYSASNESNSHYAAEDSYSDGEYRQEQCHFQLCLESSGQLVVVSSQEDEAAISSLYSSYLQLAVTGNLTELGHLYLYLLDRPVLTSDDELEEIVSETNNLLELAQTNQDIENEVVEQAQVRQQWAIELINNKQTFKALAQLAVTKKAVFHDEVQSGGLDWRQKVLAVIEELHEELISRLIRTNKGNQNSSGGGSSLLATSSNPPKADEELANQMNRPVEETAAVVGDLYQNEAAEINDASKDRGENAYEANAKTDEAEAPRIILVISDLAAVLAIEEGGRLAQLLVEGPAQNIFVVAAISYEALNGQVVTLPPALQGVAQNTNLTELNKQILTYFKSRAVFIAPDEADSNSVWGSELAFNLDGYGDMLLNIAGKQQIRLRSIQIDEMQVAECAELFAQMQAETISALAPQLLEVEVENDTIVNCNDDTSYPETYLSSDGEINPPLEEQAREEDEDEAEVEKLTQPSTKDITIAPVVARSMANEGPEVSDGDNTIAAPGLVVTFESEDEELQILTSGAAESASAAPLNNSPASTTASAPVTVTAPTDVQPKDGKDLLTTNPERAVNNPTLLGIAAEQAKNNLGAEREDKHQAKKLEVERTNKVENKLVSATVSTTRPASNPNNSEEANEERHRIAGANEAMTTGKGAFSQSEAKVTDATKVDPTLVATIQKKLAEIRWQLYTQGLVQPTLCLHLLHGLSIRFSLLPAVQTTGFGKAFRPTYPSEKMMYSSLKEYGLSFKLLNECELLHSKNAYTAAQFVELDRVLTQFCQEKAEDNDSNRNHGVKVFVPASVYEQQARREVEETLELEIERTSAVSFTTEQAREICQSLCFGLLYGLEGQNMVSEFWPAELEILCYLALHHEDKQRRDTLVSQLMQRRNSSRINRNKGWADENENEDNGFDDDENNGSSDWEDDMDSAEDAARNKVFKNRLSHTNTVLRTLTDLYFRQVFGTAAAMENAAVAFGTRKPARATITEPKMLTTTSRDKTNLAQVTSRKHGKVDPTLMIENGKETTRPEFILAEDVGRNRLFSFNTKYVWVDSWELDKLLKEYRQIEPRDKNLALSRLEEAYRLVEATAETHSDGSTENRLKLMGFAGDEFEWKDLESLRENVVTSWYDLNRRLADYYFKQYNQFHQNDSQQPGSNLIVTRPSLESMGSTPTTIAPELALEKAWEHYAQCYLVRPTWTEAVLALMQIAFARNDLSTLHSIFNDYKLNCKNDGWKCEAELKQKYDEYCVALGAKPTPRRKGGVSSNGGTISKKIYGSPSLPDSADALAREVIGSAALR